jgi:hypothetical protein
VATQRDDEHDVNREFTPEQASGRNEPAGTRDAAKDVRDELEFADNVDQAHDALAKQRMAPQHGAGITNRPLEQEEREQEKLPERNVRKASPR